MLARDDHNAAMALRSTALDLSSAASTVLRLPTLKPSGGTMTDAPNIRELTLAVRRGDRAAFSRFYDLYSFRVYKFLLMLARGDEHEAREVFQAVLIKLARRFDVCEDDQKLMAWLCVLAKNTFIDHCRARQRREHLLSSPELQPATDPLPRHQLSETLCDALATLPPDERELLQAAYIDERPLQELADASGQTYKAVESRLARLRQKLKAQLIIRLRHEHES